MKWLLRNGVEMRIIYICVWKQVTIARQCPIAKTLFPHHYIKQYWRRLAPKNLGGAWRYRDQTLRKLVLKCPSIDVWDYSFSEYKYMFLIRVLHPIERGGHTVSRVPDSFITKKLPTPTQLELSRVNTGLFRMQAPGFGTLRQTGFGRWSTESDDWRLQSSRSW
jgi:hypothetical protein